MSEYREKSIGSGSMRGPICTCVTMSAEGIIRKNAREVLSGGILGRSVSETAQA